MYAIRYRKKPVSIEAMLCGDTNEDIHDLTCWMDENFYPGLIGDATQPQTLRYPYQEFWDSSIPNKGWYIDPSDGTLMIRTLEGDMRVSLGDYVIRGINGEFYPCKPYIFENSYEEVSIGENQNNPEQVLYSLPIEPEGSIFDVNKTKWTRKFRFWESEEGNCLYWAELLSGYGPLSRVNND